LTGADGHTYSPARSSTKVLCTKETLGRADAPT